MIAIIDYGAGNLGSVAKAFRSLGAPVCVTSCSKEVAQADALVLPGVGAFSHCMKGLDAAGLRQATLGFIRSDRPFLGVCVGLQMLFESSEEMGGERGLGVLPGRNVRLRPSEAPGAPRLKVPHIGWNAIEPREGATLFQGLPARPQVYFVHSYFPEPGDPGVVSATCEHGQRFCAAVEHGNVHATQFHPEKSGAVGLAILRNFASLAA